MSYSGIYISSLAFHGPSVEPSIVSFSQGLNVIYGASNTGKSFVIETVDFMLGGKGPLPDIPEANQYDLALLSLGSLEDDRTFTLQRSLAGGAFKLFEGKFSDELPSADPLELSEIHNAKRDNNLSSYLLNLLGLNDKVVRKNKKNETVSLSFRNLARLCIVDEEEIIQKRSPLSDGNYTADTANTSVFKLLLSGVDDSSLVATRPRSTEELGREAQLELLAQLISEQEKDIRDLTGSRDEIAAQDDRLSATIINYQSQLSVTEMTFKSLSAKRRTAMKRMEEQKERYTEISGLLERFQLLRQHYGSDMERLVGIREAGSIFTVLSSETCPVCGALPDHHAPESVCTGNVDLVISAAEAEIAKIEAKELELTETIADLKAERKKLENSIPKTEKNLHELSNEVDKVVAPDLRKMRSSYQELSDKKASVREALAIFGNLEGLKLRKSQLEQANNITPAATGGTGHGLTNSVVDPFSELVQEILTNWEFPGGERVYFDLEAKDLVISGKPRTSYGKGLRAITQAAFSIALREYCRAKDNPHPGFVLLDSPLLSYKEPDDPDDDLRKTNLNMKFYDYLDGLGNNGQTIIIENTDPPQKFRSDKRFKYFSGLKGVERFGLFESKG